jgi:hypothetical protein
LKRTPAQRLLEGSLPRFDRVEADLHGDRASRQHREAQQQRHAPAH